MKDSVSGGDSSSGSFSRDAAAAKSYPIHKPSGPEGKVGDVVLNADQLAAAAAANNDPTVVIPQADINTKIVKTVQNTGDSPDPETPISNRETDETLNKDDKCEGECEKDHCVDGAECGKKETDSAAGSEAEMGSDSVIDSGASVTDSEGTTESSLTSATEVGGSETQVEGGGWARTRQKHTLEFAQSLVNLLSSLTSQTKVEEKLAAVDHTPNMASLYAAMANYSIDYVSKPEIMRCPAQPFHSRLSLWGEMFLEPELPLEATP
jgi:hypothetical protein